MQSLTELKDEIHKSQFLTGPNFPTCIVAAILLVLTLWPLFRHDWNPTWFHKFGTTYVDPVRRPQNAVVFDGGGYDGQFYYSIARDPFARGDAGKYTDGGAYRYGRIGLPWLAALLSLGQVPALSWAFILINFLGLVFGTWIVSQYYVRNGAPPWYGALFGLSSGLLISHLYATTEILSLVLLAAAILCMKVQKFWQATLFLCYAILCRETTFILLIPLAMLFPRLPSGENVPRSVFIFPVLVYAIWHVYVFTVIGSPYDGYTATGNPFAGIWAMFRNEIPGADFNYVWRIVPVVVFAAAVLPLIPAGFQFLKTKSFLALTLFFSSILATKFTALSWSHPANYMRITADIFFLCLILGAGPGGKPFRWFAAFNAAISLPILFWLSKG